MAYDYQPLDFDNILPTGGGSGFTGTGQLGFQAQLPDMNFGYSPDTGGYTPIDFGALTSGAGRGGFQLPAGGIPQMPGLQAPAPVQLPGGIPSARGADAYTGAGFRLPQLAAGPVAAATGAPGGAAPAGAQEPGILDRATKGVEDIGAYLKRNPTLARLLGAGVTGGLGALMSGRAQQAAGGLERRLGKLGEAQRQQGQALVAAAQRGELTAPQQQQLEAFRAQQSQALASRGIGGGTAEQQLNAQVERMRQEFLQQNLQTGLALLQVGDAYTQQAITAGYNASQQAQNTAGRFYQAMFQGLGAMPPTQPAAQQTTQQPTAA